MKDRLLLLVGILLTLLLLLVLFMPAPQERHSLPRSEDRGAHGLVAMNRFLQASGVTTHSLKQPYSALLDGELPSPTGNLLVVAVPHRLVLAEDEPEALADWVREGNHVVLLGMSELRGGVESGADTAGRLLEPAGLQVKAADDFLTDGNADSPLRMSRQLEHGLLRDATVLAAASTPRMFDVWPTLADRDDAPLVVRMFQAADRPTWWWIPVEPGGYWVTSHGGSATNTWIGEADNARLMLNLAGYALSKGGRVVFDDYHQGLTDRYDADAFYGDRRFHLTVLFVIGFWLFYAFGRNDRLAPRQPRMILPRAADRVDASAGLYARRVRDAEIARGLIRHFHNTVRRLHGLPLTGEPAWEYLERNPRIDQRDVRTLQRMCVSLPRRNGPLIRLSQQICKVRNQIA